MELFAVIQPIIHALDVLWIYLVALLAYKAVRK